jgi:hypothetical protein
MDGFKRTFSRAPLVITENKGRLHATCCTRIPTHAGTTLPTHLSSPMGDALNRIYDPHPCVMDAVHDKHQWWTV